MKRLNRRLVKSRYNKYIFPMLVAMEILMSFLGCVHVPPMVITHEHIPILAAAIWLGPLQAAAVGTVFGLCSMYKASAVYMVERGGLLSSMISEAPIESILLGAITRMLFGLLIGLLILWIKKHPRWAGVWVGIVAVISSRLHTIIMQSTMWLLFPNQGILPFHGIFQMPELRDIVLDVLCLLVVEWMWRVYHSSTAKEFRTYIELGGNVSGTDTKRHHRLRVLGAGAFATALCACVASAFYFTQRTSYMMEAHGLALANTVQSDLLQLQIQFLLAVLSLGCILGLGFLSVYQCLIYREYLGQLDEVTSLMGRRMFRSFCEHKLQENAQIQDGGCFLFVDVDHFKRINDTMGHPAGDMVLRSVAERLQNSLSANGQVGRMGGDEFAVLMDFSICRKDLEQRLDNFMTELSGILPEYGPITCSIGVYFYQNPSTLDQVYAETDRLLYSAKENGRAKYVIGGTASCN